MTFNSPLFRPLPSGCLDIIGDVHGEFNALMQLIHYLGYDDLGAHPQGRKLVFVGDLCDRGPNSPAVMQWIVQAANAERAFAVLGNHELNILIHDVKDGSGWYFDERRTQDEQRYAPWHHIPHEQRSNLHEELTQWPLVLQREDLRIIHAAWLPESLQRISSAGNMPIIEQYQFWTDAFKHKFKQSQWYDLFQEEKHRFHLDLNNESTDMTFKPGVAHYDLMYSQDNPIRAILCGTETIAPQPFYTNGRWRFTVRMPWWQQYADAPAVVMGHYWRDWYNNPQPKHRQGLFHEPPDHWLGAAQQVYCIDFSVGARWKERKQGILPTQSRFHLAALRWPEQTIMLDNGSCVPSIRKLT